MKTKTKNIHIIGGGNLGVALAKGLAKYSPKSNLTVTRRNVELINELEDLNISVSSDNTSGISKADIIILAVKPYQADIVIKEILENKEGMNKLKINPGVEGKKFIVQVIISNLLSLYKHI